MWSLRSSGVSWRDVDGQVVVLDLSNSAFFELNGPGSTLWRALSDGPMTRDALITQLTSAYEVDQATASADVDSFVSSLLDAGFLETELA